MQVSPQTIRVLCLEPDPLITPFRESYRHKLSGLSGGLSCAGYDVHMGDQVMALPCFSKLPVKQDTRGVGPVWVLPPRTGCLAVTEERFHLPNNLAMHYYNKSSLARKFLTAAATLGEPGWHGHLTLEIYNQTDDPFILYPGQPIGQVVFIQLDYISDQPYTGKYQNQENKPVGAK